MELHPHLETGELCRRRLPKRYIVVLLGFFGLFNVFSMRIVLSVALVAMVNNNNNSSHHNGSIEASECPIPYDARHSAENTNYAGDRFDWSPQVQSMVLSSYFYGYIVTQLSGGYLAERYGAARVFGGGILLAGILTFFTPLMVGWWGVAALVAARGITGFGSGVAIPSIVALFSSWSPKLERARMSSLVFSGNTAGTVYAMGVSGWLCGTDFLGGWPAVFYVTGTCTCLWFLFWYTFIYDSPYSNPTITREELSLFFDIEKTEDKAVVKVPWKQIAISVPFWALMLGNVGSFFGLTLSQILLPTYFGTALRFSVNDTGMYSAAQGVALFMGMWLMPFAADKVRSSKVLSITAIRKLFQAISGYGPAVCLLSVTLSGCRSAVIVSLFCLSGSLMAGMYSGFSVTHVEMAPDYAGTLYGLTNGVAGLAGVISPAMVGYFTADGYTLANWNKVFYSTAAFYIFTTTVFVVFASAKLQPWGKVTKKDIKSPVTEILMSEQIS